MHACTHARMRARARTDAGCAPWPRLLDPRAPLRHAVCTHAHTHNTTHIRKRIRHATQATHDTPRHTPHAQYCRTHDHACIDAFMHEHTHASIHEHTRAGMDMCGLFSLSTRPRTPPSIPPYSRCLPARPCAHARAYVRKCVRKCVLAHSRACVHACARAHTHMPYDLQLLAEAMDARARTHAHMAEHCQLRSASRQGHADGPWRAAGACVCAQHVCAACTHV